MWEAEEEVRRRKTEEDALLREKASLEASLAYSPRAYSPESQRARKLIESPEISLTTPHTIMKWSSQGISRYVQGLTQGRNTY